MPDGEQYPWWKRQWLWPWGAGGMPSPRQVAPAEPKREDWERLTEQEYISGLRALLQSLKARGEIDAAEQAAYMDAALRQLVAGGDPRNLPMYSQISGRVLTPEVKKAKWEAYVPSGKMPWEVSPEWQSWRGQQLAERATAQRELIPRSAQMGGGWLRPTTERAAQYAPTGGPYSPDLIQQLTRAEELGINTQDIQKAMTQPWPNRPDDSTLATILNLRIGTRQQTMLQAQAKGWMQEQAPFKQLYPKEWAGIEAKGLKGGAYYEPTGWERAAFIERMPEYQALKQKRQFEYQTLPRMKLETQKIQKEREQETRQAELWHKPGRWAVPRQRA